MKGPRAFRLGAAIVVLLVLVVATGSHARETITGTNGMVAGGHFLAVQEGVRILEKGGNAVDAIVALFAVQSLAKADMMGPLGGGWALIYMSKTGKIVALDMDTKAPAAASAEKMKAAFIEAGLTGPRGHPSPMVRGPLAATVGGNLKGWEAMLDRYGTMSFAQVFERAIEYADKGWPVDHTTANVIKAFRPETEVFPTWVEVFMPGGKPPKPGQKIHNKNLANTFRRIAALGADVVYKGEIADEIDRYYKEVGGWITKEDMANYDVVWSEPVTTTYTSSDGVEYTLYGNQPPSSSIQILETLKILDGYDIKAMGLNTVEFLHHFIEAEKLAHLDNYRYVGDPAFVDVPVKWMVSEEHAKELRAKISSDKAIEVEVWSEYPAGKKSSEYPSGKKSQVKLAHGESVTFQEGHSTTHAVVVDRYGNCVSMTNTHGTFYGAGFIIGKTGLLAANGMDWFDIEKSPYTNELSADRIEPGKRNRWTLSPVMVFKDGKPYIVIGGCGSEATMVGITLPILHMIEFGLTIQDALYVPRVRWGDIMHYAGGTDVWVERSWIGRTISDDIVEALAAKGHKIVPRDRAGDVPFAGYTNGVMIDPETGALMGGCEFRPGFVGGYTRDFAAGF